MGAEEGPPREVLVTLAAGVALHALIATGRLSATVDGTPLVSAAFDIAEKFVAEAERRFPGVTQ